MVRKFVMAHADLWGATARWWGRVNMWQLRSCAESGVLGDSA